MKASHSKNKHVKIVNTWGTVKELKDLTQGTTNKGIKGAVNTGGGSGVPRIKGVRGVDDRRCFSTAPRGTPDFASDWVGLEWALCSAVLRYAALGCGWAQARRKAMMVMLLTLVNACTHCKQG